MQLMKNCEGKMFLDKKIDKIIILAVFTLFGCDFSGGEVVYEYSEVTKETLETTVTSSGALEPLTSVDVGTQVSGKITSVLVDYNDIVKKGQLLAVIDTFLLKLSVDEALANLEKSNANLEEAKLEYNQNKTLFDKELISQKDFIPYKTAYKTAQAQLKLSKISYTKAKQNLDYAYIKSPINGVIIAKEVEEGQTVASSLSAPTLFNVAQDLSKIKILASVDESDIGTIKEGMQAKFTVQSYSDKEYIGEVSQIRLQAIEESNVINYIAVILAENKDLSLLPGMTTTVDFVVEKKENALVVPSMALKFNPPEEIQKQAMQKRKEEFQKRKKSGASYPNAMGGKSSKQQMKMLWIMNENDKLEAIPIRIGITNGSKTEIFSKDERVKEGLKIVLKSSTKKASSQISSKPEQNKRMGGGNPRF